MKLNYEIELFEINGSFDKYQLGTSANIKNLKKAMQDKNLIDVMPNSVCLQDPVFGFWLNEKY